MKEYLSDNMDISANRLVVYSGNNGDWYISIRKPGEKIGVSVRISTSGTLPGYENVASAVAKLYDVIPENKIDFKQ